jgi:hypothetical protein
MPNQCLIKLIMYIPYLKLIPLNRIFRLSRKTKHQYHINKIFPLDTILSHLNLVNTFTHGHISLAIRILNGDGKQTYGASSGVLVKSKLTQGGCYITFSYKEGDWLYLHLQTVVPLQVF